jgi:Ca2+-transporting ATPase
LVRAIHTAIKGRARYKIKGLYRSESLKKHIECRLSEKEGISHFSVNLLTSNILVFFNSNDNAHTIASFIEGIVIEHNKQNHCNASAMGYKTDGSNSLSLRGEAKAIFGNKIPRSTRNVNISRRKLRKAITHAEDQRIESWHLMDSQDVIDLLKTSKDSGLSEVQAKENLKKYGPNVLPESVPRSGLSILIDQFKSLPVALLGAAVGLSIVTGGLADALVILGVVAINGAIGYITESQSEKTIHSLKSLVRPSALIIREGRLREIGAEDIVPGDIMVLRPGSYVAADARLIEAHHLSVDESALTGESMPVIKTVQSLEFRVMSDIPLADRTNMVYMGTLVTGGQGIAVVVATGRFTEMGKIQTLVGEARTPETPMERQLNRIGTQLVLIGGAICGAVFIIGLIRGYGFLQMLKTSISLAVAAVPEGLPTVATTTLALGIRNMKRHNVLIRHLDAVETLGSVQTICLDKTGTITMNRMTVVEVYTGMKRLKVSDGKFVADEEFVNPYACEELLRLIHVSVLCNETEVGMQEGKYILSGSPTENAFIHMAISSGVDVIRLRERYLLLKMNHRSENRNYMTTIHEFLNTSKIIALKGSPNEVLAMCDQHIKDNKKFLLTDEDRLAIETENERMAGNALRVLGVAYYYMENGDEDFNIQSGFIWLGLVGMADPVREGVKELISSFHGAGIDTVMITGDQSSTAYAIGKELNLSKGEQLEILDSTHLANIEPNVLKALAERVHVFSRVSPAHKLQIVQALQKAGKVVAMTGDGINDGPALKQANIGIAMGTTGTDVAREVADIVLEDDNLETMIIAISHGRTIYNNIRKSVHFLLSTNMSEIMVMFTGIAGGLGQPLNAMQLLWINLISDIAPGLALALEPPEPDVLSRPPRDPEEPILKSSDFKRIAIESAILSAGSLISYGYGIARYGIGQQASTMAFMSLTLGQILHAISCRSEKHSIFDKDRLPPNRYLNAAIAGSLSLQVLSMALPGLRSLLGITPISLIDSLVIGSSATIPLLVNESIKKAIDNR